MKEQPLSTSIVITTKNRKEDLRRALSSCLRQTITSELIVIDDGSTDGTEELVRKEFPTVRIVREEVSKGYIVQRNRGAQLASGDIIFSIDDDAEFSSPHSVEQTLLDFDRSSVAAVTIPFINVNSSDTVHRRAPDAKSVFLTDAFIGTAHAIRRDVFLMVGGYREFLFHQGEEEDLCIRMLDIGRYTRLGSADHINHYHSPVRDHRRISVYRARNRLLFSWYNVPMPHLLLDLPASTINNLIFGFKVGRPAWAMQGILKGLADCTSQLAERHPVRADTYRLFRELRRGRGLPLEAVGHRLRLPIELKAG